MKIGRKSFELRKRILNFALLSKVIYDFMLNLGEFIKKMFRQKAFLSELLRLYVCLAPGLVANDFGLVLSGTANLG